MCARTSTSSFGRGVTGSRSMSASPLPGARFATASQIPAASAAISPDDFPNEYQAEGLSASHCRASVVFPYPAGATSILMRPWLSSSRRVNRGRSMIRRRPTCAVAVPSAILRSLGAASPLRAYLGLASFNRRSRDPADRGSAAVNPSTRLDRGLVREGLRRSGSGMRSGADAGDGLRACVGARRNAP